MDPGAAAPPARANAILAFDPISRRLLLHGGRDGGGLSDLWSYDVDAGSWRELPSVGEPPAARWGHAGVIDPASGNLVIFPGQGAGRFFDDVWTYETARGSWRSRTDEGAGSVPSARYGLGYALTPDRQLMISHGLTSAGRFDDTWSLNLDLDASPWRDDTPSGIRPSARCLHGCVIDDASAQLILFGGQNNSIPYLGDTWILSDGEWREVSSPGPSARRFPTLVAEGGQVWLFGGRTAQGASGELWVLDLATQTWRQVDFPAGPSARHSHAAALDPAGCAIYVAAGRDSNA